MKKLLIVAMLCAIFGFSASANSQEKKGPLYATLKTSMGDIVIQLFEESAQDRRQLRRPRQRHQGVDRHQDRRESEEAAL